MLFAIHLHFRVMLHVKIALCSQIILTSQYDNLDQKVWFFPNFLDLFLKPDHTSIFMMLVLLHTFTLSQVKKNIVAGTKKNNGKCEKIKIMQEYLLKMAIQNINFKRTILTSSSSLHYNGCQF